MLGASGIHLGLSSGHIGALMGLSWSLSGPSWGLLGHLLGLSWSDLFCGLQGLPIVVALKQARPLGDIIGPSRGIVGGLWDSVGLVFGPYWTRRRCRWWIGTRLYQFSYWRRIVPPDSIWRDARFGGS